MLDLNDDEKRSLVNCLRKHEACAATIKLCAGFDYGYSVKATPTNIGVVFEAMCTICDKSENITDYGSW
jgi:hypothetical protein